MKSSKKKVLKKPDEKIYKTFASELKVADDIKRALMVTISTPNEDRSGDTMNMKGMQYDNFIKNPVVLFAHKYDSKPIAKCISLQVTDKAAVATVEFTPEGLYQEADIIYQMYKSGFLNAWSIGFMPQDYDVNKSGGYDFNQWELFEFSSVPVPDNPEALTIMRSKGINVDYLLKKQDGEEENTEKEEPAETEEEDIEEEEEEIVTKGAIGYKETPKAPEDEAWDAGAEVKKASVDDLKAMCTWYDSANPDVKGSYKLPHHKADGDHAVVWNGVAAAMGALLGARGGVDIPDGDRKGCYNHLKKHYAQFEKDVPDFKSFEALTKLLSQLSMKGVVTRFEAYMKINHYKQFDKESKALFDEALELSKKFGLTLEIEDVKVETKALPAGDEDNPKDPGYTEDTKVTDLNVKQLIDIIDRTLDAEEDEDENEPDGKSAPKVVKKDVDEVIALAQVLDCLSFFAWLFEMNGVSQPTLDKLQQAQALVMEIVQEQAVLGQKGFKITDLLNTKESVKQVAKAGRAISSKHEQMLKDACDHMEKGMGKVQTVLQAVAENPDDEKQVKPKETKEAEAAPEAPVKEDLMKKLANSIKNNSQQQAARIRQENENKTLMEKILAEIKLKGGDKK